LRLSDLSKSQRPNDGYDDNTDFFHGRNREIPQKKGLVTPETGLSIFRSQSLKGPGNWIYTKELGSR
jgi:hypothetical protein